MYQVFDRARPFDEDILPPGGMLYGKAEGNPSGVDSDWDAYYRIAYGVSAIVEETVGWKSSYLLAQPAVVLGLVDHIRGARRTPLVHRLPCI